METKERKKEKKEKRHREKRDKEKKSSSKSERKRRASLVLYAKVVPLWPAVFASVVLDVGRSQRSSGAE